MRIVDLVFVIILGVYSTLIVMDSIGVITDPESYRIGQEFSEEVLSVSSPSVVAYLFKNGALLLFFLTLIMLSFKNFKGKLNATWKRIYYILVFGLFILVIEGYYSWMKSGFDH